MMFQREIGPLLGSGLDAIQVTLVHERGRGGAISLHCDCGLRNLVRLNFKVMSTVCLVEKISMQESHSEYVTWLLAYCS